MDAALRAAGAEIFANLCLVHGIDLDAAGEVVAPRDEAWAIHCEMAGVGLDRLEGVDALLRAHLAPRYVTRAAGRPVLVARLPVTHYYCDDGRCVFVVDRLLAGRFRYGAEEVAHPPRTPLMPHQAHCIVHMQRHRALLCEHPTGSGKTLIGAGVAAYHLRTTAGHVYYVGPKSLKRYFLATLAANYALSAEEQDRVHAFTYHKFTSEFLGGALAPAGSLIIIDEAHEYRTQIRDSDRYRQTLEVVPKAGAVRTKAMLLAAAQAAKVLMLTATPGVNLCSDYSNLMAVARGAPVPMEAGEFGRRICAPDGTIRDPAAFDAFFRDAVHTFNLPPELLREFPTLRSHAVSIPMSGEYYDEYKNVEDERLSEEQRERLGSGDLRAFYNGTRRVVGCKVDAINQKLAWVLRLHEQNPVKTLIFSPFIELGVKELRRALATLPVPPRLGFIQGECKEVEREDTINAYNADEVDVMLVSTKAGGVGINCKKTRRIIVMQDGWHKVDYWQSVGRGWRYRSHAELPPEERVVDVYLLQLTRPGQDAAAPAIDSILHSMGLRKEGALRHLRAGLERIAL